MLADVAYSDFQWWANAGVASAILFCIGGAFAYAAKQWWAIERQRRQSRQQREAEFEEAKQKMELEHAAAKQAMEIEREQKTLVLLSTLTESHSEDIEFKRRQLALMEKVDSKQTNHADDCHHTHILVEEIHRKIVRPEGS